MFLGKRLSLISAVALGAMILVIGPFGSVRAATPEPATGSQTPLAKATPTLEPQSTPGPPLPTSALPEEGGPPGGVLGGYVYTDDDGDGRRSAGDSTTVGTILVRGVDLVGGGYPYLFTVQTDVRGYWELRGVPDGHFEVLFDPPLRDPADLARTIPPARVVTIGRDTVTRAVREVEVVKANRILDIDFGIPVQFPVAAGNGAAPRLPNTGGGGGSMRQAPLLLLAGALALSLLLAAGIARSRRRA